MQRIKNPPSILKTALYTPTSSNPHKRKFSTVIDTSHAGTDTKLHQPARKKERHSALKRYQHEVLNIDHDQNTATDIGKLPFLVGEAVSSSQHTEDEKDTCVDTEAENKDIFCNDIDDDPAVNKLRAELTEPEIDLLQQAKKSEQEETNKFGIPSVNELLKTEFGRPNKDHSFTQEASFETIVFQVMKRGYEYLDEASKMTLKAAHPLLDHMRTMIQYYSTIDFTSLREYDPNYATQKEIPRDRVKRFMACLFHFDLSMANVMRYVGNNYTAVHRDIKDRVECL